MRIAPLSILALLGIACGGSSPGQASPSVQATSDESRAGEPHPLAGDWTLRSATDRGRIRLTLRVDSVARDSMFGRLTFYMAGDAAFLTPDDWGPLAGTVGGDTVQMVIMAGARALEIGVAGRTTGDTVRLTTLRIGADTMPGAWLLVRTTVSRP